MKELYKQKYIKDKGTNLTTETGIRRNSKIVSMDEQLLKDFLETAITKPI